MISEYPQHIECRSMHSTDIYKMTFPHGYNFDWLRKIGDSVVVFHCQDAVVVIVMEGAFDEIEYCHRCP